MDTNVIRISIAGIFCLAMQAHAEQIEVSSLLPFGGPKAIILEGPIRTYDKNVGTAKCCIGNEFTAQTRLNYWGRLSELDLMCAVQLSWHFLRYQIAPRRTPMRENCQGALTDPYRRFPAKEPSLFRVDGAVSTNIVMRIFPFRVGNPVSASQLDCCLVTFHQGKNFICGLYVNLNTGEVGLDFRTISGCLPLVSLETYCPFMSLSEYEIQTRFFPNAEERHKKEKRSTIAPYQEQPRPPIESVVDVEI